jgi:hypothetical protein
MEDIQVLRTLLRAQIRNIEEQIDAFKAVLKILNAELSEEYEVDIPVDLSSRSNAEVVKYLFEQNKNKHLRVRKIYKFLKHVKPESKMKMGSFYNVMYLFQKDVNSPIKRDGDKGFIWKE